MMYKKHIANSSSRKIFSNKSERKEINKAISAVYAQRENLLRDLKDTNSLLVKLMSQIDLDEEYKNLTRV